MPDPVCDGPELPKIPRSAFHALFKEIEPESYQGRFLRRFKLRDSLPILLLVEDPESARFYFYRPH